MSFRNSYLIILTVITVLLPQILSQDPALGVLAGRVNQLNLTSIATRAELTSLSTRVTGISNRLTADTNYLISFVDAVSQNVSAVHVEVGANTDAISGLTGRVDALAADLATANMKIAKLQAVNVIWRNNFRVVNKTFTELRKKVRFFVPRGQRVIGSIPLPYYFRPRVVGNGK